MSLVTGANTSISLSPISEGSRHFESAAFSVDSLIRDQAPTRTMSDLGEAGSTANNGLIFLLRNLFRSITQLGNFNGYLRPEVEPILGTVPDLNMPNLGFEDVRVSVGGQTAALETVIKVRHPGEFFMLNTHGQHNGAIEVLGAAVNTTGVILPQQMTIKNTLFRGVKTTTSVWFASCSSLDLHDYNNIYAMGHLRGTPTGPQQDAFYGLFGGKPEEFKEHLPHEGLEGAGPGGTIIPKRVSGGLQWWLALNVDPSVNVTNSIPAPTNGTTTLLGYNAPAPNTLLADIPIGLVLQDIEVLLPSLQQNMALAWVAANLRVGQTAQSSAVRFLCFNACAWDAQHYYYIPYQIAASGLLPDPKSIQVVVRIPRDQWLKGTPPAGWGNFPPDPLNTGFTELVYTFP